MSDVMKFKSYREFIKAIVKGRLPYQYKQAELAKAMSCQAAYLSQVIKDRSELTEEQALRLCHFLEFKSIETNYFLTLLRISRAGTPALKQHLESQLNEITLQFKELSPRLNTEQNSESSEAMIFYCSSWIPPLVHLSVSIDKYQTVEALAERLTLKEDIVKECLKKLLKYGFVTYENKKWKFSGNSFHIPKGSGLDLSFLTQQHLYTLAHLPQRSPEDVHFSQMMTLDAQTANTIRNLLLDFLETNQKRVAEAPSEELYNLSLGFFKV